MHARSGPAEADPPLVVHADAVLALAVALERFEPVAWRNEQVLERGLDVFRFELDHQVNVIGQPHIAVRVQRYPVGDEITNAGITQRDYNRLECDKFHTPFRAILLISVPSELSIAEWILL